MNKWSEYEQEKKNLPQNLSPEEYSEAIRKICEKLNI